MARDTHIETVPILGVPVGALDMERTLDTIGTWVRHNESRYICAPDVFNISSAQTNPAHMAALQDADLIVPDGTPLTWVGRLRGNRQMKRVCGPDLLLAACERSVREGWRHYFYGGAEGVAEELARRLCERYPGLRVAGAECPPFRPLTEAETRRIISRVRDAGTDIMWIGLGCPKQEIWMHKHSKRLKGITLVGVGAAFDFHTGRISRAPAWMRNSGLEWMHRLASEPRRLWRRYCYHAPRFVFLSLFETMRLARSARS